MLKVKIVNTSGNDLPEYTTEYSAGLDLRASLKDYIKIAPMERILISTGIFIQLPKGYEAQIRPRSGLAIKHGITILNTPGTIDADYRGEVKVILINLSTEEYTINNGERICQMVINRFEQIQWEEVDTLEESARGAGGFGHTGSN